ncbi:unnamed protein product [Larinioides sclopetarius]|uniref:Uncharacterized protein n=1 Tax=Larinioides sclopetarius TaxID=280406 RepID=A0AAV2AGM1_9ARAC
MRVRWNRQLDGSLARRQAEEEAAAAAAQLGKDKHKSTPKIFRIFRRKKTHRRPDEESGASPCTPSEADDEDCASISSVASQPVTELCHRDRTVSLFSSFRLNFPGGKKKSKRGGGTPLFQESEPENNRYSSPDLMREKLAGAAARPQTELSKSSPSVRNTNDSAASIPGEFPSLGELRAETSVSFQQLKHVGAKSGPDVAKLAKSVSFSDCQATVNSKQVTCASARTFRTQNGRTEPKTSGKKCLSHPTDVPEKVCESKSTCDGNTSLRLPAQPSFWKSAVEPGKVKTEDAMSEIVSSSSHRIEQRSKEAPRDKCEADDVRGKWFSEAHRSFEKSVEGLKISDKPIVILNGNAVAACNGPALRDMCSTKVSHASDFLRGSSCISSSGGPRTSPAQLRDGSDKVGNVYSAEQVLKSHKVQDDSDRCDKMPDVKSSSRLFKNVDLTSSAANAPVADASENEVVESDMKPSTVEVSSALQNVNEFTSTRVVNSERKVLCNGYLKNHESSISKSDCVLSDVSYSVSNTKVSENSDLNMLPDSEKRLLNEMLRDFGLNTVENEEYSVSLGVCPNLEINSTNNFAPKTENVFDNSIQYPLALSLGDKDSNGVNGSHQSLSEVPFNNSPVSDELEKVQPLTYNTLDDFFKLGVLQDSEISNGSDSVPSVTSSNVIDLNNPDIIKTENTFIPLHPTNIVKSDEPSAPLVNGELEPIICIETDATLQLDTPHDSTETDGTIMMDKILEPDFLSDNLILKENYLMANELENKKALTVSQKQSFSPLLLTYLKSCNNFLNDSLLHFNILSLLPENTDLCSSCCKPKKSSVLDLTCHLDDLNNNALCDAESYLGKLTEASSDLLRNDSGSDKHARSVTVWNASFVQSFIFPCEMLPNSIDSSCGRALSDHVPSSYATDCGKLRLEERCPDASSPPGSSSSHGVTLQGSDLHTDGIDTTPDPGDGSEMLAKVGASLAFCEKTRADSPSVFLEEIKGDCAEIYDGPRCPEVCDKNLISFSSESYNSFTAESCTDCEIVLSGEWDATKSSSNLLEPAFTPSVQDEVVVNGHCSGENAPGLISLDIETIHSGMSNESLPVPDLISNGYCFENDDVGSTSNMLDSTIESNIEDQTVVNGSNSAETSTSSDISSHVIVTMREGEIINGFPISNSVIPNGYHSADDLPTEFRNGICDISTSLSMCDEHVLDVASDELEINNVKEKIQFFENSSPGIPAENYDSERPRDEKTTSTRRKSFERSKSSMIPSLKKGCLKAVSEKQFQSQKLDSKKFKNEETTQPSIDNDSSVTKAETTDEFQNILPANDVPSDGNDRNNSSCVTGAKWSLESNHLNDSGVDNEHHFVIEISSSSSSEISKRCRSEELLSAPSKVHKFKSRLQTRRHSSTETNSCGSTHVGGKALEKSLTTGLASPVDLSVEETSSQRSSDLTLSEVPGVQGQSECGLQSRCASLPLVIGQVGTTSPLNYARRNCPIKDAPRGKSRIPRKQGGTRGALHPKRPPMWLSKAELTAEIQRLGTLCEARTKELNRLKMETKHVSVGFDAFASLFKYMVEDLNALSMPMLAEDLKKTLKQLELAKQDLAYYEREVEEMKAHHCQELNDLSNKLFEVFHGEVTELSAKHQEEMDRLKSDHQLQIESLSTTFDASSQETLAKHEAAVAKLQQELISQREELQQLHEREIADLQQKHTHSTKTLQEHIEQLQKKCAELKQHSMGMEDAMRKDTDTKLQWVTSRKVDLEKEVESLKAVLEMKNKELHTLRVQNLEMEKQMEELPLAREKIKMLQARAEDLEALMIEKTKLERKLSTENQQIRDTYERESKVNKRLSMENEELLWRIRQAEQSFLSESFSEYPEDVENGSISPTKSPPPHMSRSVFFTYVDKEDLTSSPRSQYKKISPGFAASYKTSPYKSPPAPSPRRAKSNSEPPQPPSHSSSTPRKGSKQAGLKKKRQRSGSDCGKGSGEPADVTFLSVAGSMTSSVSSESSVFGERLLEEHKEQILESLEILREQRSSKEESSPTLEGDDMSRSSEFSDPKTYYHMTFPVSGMPDCDITAQHSSSEILPSQEIDSQENASSVKMAHSFENVRESECEKQSKEDRWRTI